MKFFKENNDKSKEVPSLPAGNGGIESCEDGFETFHPGICAFNFPSLLIHFLIIQPLFCRLLSVFGVRADIRNNSIRDKGTSEGFPIKTGIEVTEEPVNGDFRSSKLADDFIYPVSIS